MKLRVGVIFGGRSGEHEVSLVSAASVIRALDKNKYDFVPIGITRDGRWVSSPRALEMLKSNGTLDSRAQRYLLPEPNRNGLMSLNGEVKEQLDVLFPVVHGTYGEDGTLQGLLELANIPYVGAGVLGSALGMDKIVQKQLFAQAGLPTTKYVGFSGRAVRESSARVMREVERNLKYPLFVKPANTGSSVAITKVHNRKELPEALQLAAEYDRRVIVEQGVQDVREIECSVLGNEDPLASVPGEIIPSNEFYDYDAKYVDGKSVALVPAALPKKIAETTRRLAVRAFAVLDCAGMARVDFFLTRKTNRLYLNEINTIPGFTSISMYPKLWEASGLPYPELLDRLLDLAIERHREKNALRTTYRPKADWYKD